ncbi:annexin B10-like [Neocloeon triangulifer]|uniref:annexin B10-like n=1 Tax=Neocloeon triangulifer TaxID=2078957 RepID=UPI00286FAA97|nr:annexin B10-like [Neocloeon triangulifer]
MSQQIQQESSQIVQCPQELQQCEQRSGQITQQTAQIVEQQTGQCEQTGQCVQQTERYEQQTDQCDQTGQCVQQTERYEQQTDQCEKTGQCEQQTSQSEWTNKNKSGAMKQPCGAADDAAALRKAMKGAGTNEKVIIEIITQRTCVQRQEIMKCYNKEFGRDLIADLKEELGGHFEDVIVALMTCQHEFLAKDLHKGIKGKMWGTVVEILCPRNSHEIKKISDIYWTMFDVSVIDHLSAESQNELQDLLILMSRGLRGTSIDPDKARQNAVHLYDSPSSRMQESTAKGVKKAAPLKEAKKELNIVLLIEILTHDSYSQCQLTFKEFKNIHGMYIDDIVHSETAGDLQKALLTSIDCCRNIPNFFANRLHKAFDRAGTDDVTLIRIIVSRFEVDLDEIAKAYERSYDKALTKAIESETSGDYKRALLALVAGFSLRKLKR